MLVWRLVGLVHEATALTGDGASRYGGRWNRPGEPVVYTADSLALATLEMSVHLTGARVTYAALQLDVPGEPPAVEGLPPSWADDPAATQRIGSAWVTGSGSLALMVPSVIVDRRSNEGNVLLNPRHPGAGLVRILQRFEVTLDRRL